MSNEVRKKDIIKEDKQSEKEETIKEQRKKDTIKEDKYQRRQI